MSANPMREPAEWHTFRVAGFALPGIATVTGCVDASKLDVRKGSATSGATVVYQGGEPTAFKVTLQLMNEDDYDAWLASDARRILLAPPTGSNAKAFAVDHPACQECNIGSAVKKSVSQGEQQSDLSRIVTIELQPTTPPKPASGTPNGSQTKWVDNPKSAASNAESVLAELQKQASAA